MISPPSPWRVWLSALATVALALLVWWIVEVRSAAPPPPIVEIPGR